MYQIIQTAYFKKWQESLKDLKAKAKIEVRIRQMETGILGDVKPVGEGVSETRIHYGHGYRLYFCQQDKTVIILLCGGDKSTQSKDIEKAKELKQCLQAKKTAN